MSLIALNPGIGDDVLYWVLIAVMMVGVAGALLPGLPSSIFIVGAILVWGAVKGFSVVTIPLVVTLIVLLLSTGVELLATYWGVKKIGASHWSQIGSVIGLFAGIFGLLPALPFGGPLIGILLGPILGAFIGEFLYRKEMELSPRLQLSLKVCLGIVVGSIVGNIIKTILALAAVITFVIVTWPTLGT